MALSRLYRVANVTDGRAVASGEVQHVEIELERLDREAIIDAVVDNTKSPSNNPFRTRQRQG